jgi:hypothetical protein
MRSRHETDSESQHQCDTQPQRTPHQVLLRQARTIRAKKEWQAASHRVIEQRIVTMRRAHDASAQ